MVSTRLDMEQEARIRQRLEGMKQGTALMWRRQATQPAIAAAGEAQLRRTCSFV